MKNGRVHKEHEDNPDRWLVSYADFITLLFAFFTVLYATSQANLEKAKEFEQSIKKYLIKAGAFGSSGQDINQGQIHNSPIDQPVKTFPQAADQEVDETQKKIEIFLEQNLSDDELERVLRDVSSDGPGVRISLAADEIFAEASARLKPKALPVLDKLAHLLAESKTKILVESHTDDSPIKSDLYPSQWELSANRATTVVRYLIKVRKIDGQRLAAVSYGPERPVVPNDSEPNRRRNQRLDFLILNESSPF